MNYIKSRKKAHREKRIKPGFKKAEKHWRIKRVHQLKSEGYSIAAISRKVGVTRQIVYKDLKTTRKPSHIRESKYQAYQGLIQRLVQEGQPFKKIEASCRECQQRIIIPQCRRLKNPHFHHLIATG